MIKHILIFFFFPIFLSPIANAYVCSTQYHSRNRPYTFEEDSRNKDLAKQLVIKQCREGDYHNVKGSYDECTANLICRESGILSYMESFHVEYKFKCDTFARHSPRVGKTNREHSYATSGNNLVITKNAAINVCIAKLGVASECMVNVECEEIF